MAAHKTEKRRRKPKNPQLEEDPYTFVNPHGEVELRIDDDDGVVELVMAPGVGRQRPTDKTKPKSKQQQRREAKKMGMGPLNPFAKRVHIRDY
ncbi:unnamed protein product [Phytomonas sp. Hart1]|nr:unnamed protein product [Phytomonas sp. Hart1]|eukprot:CCW69031.1 unnamed protein product [Phytomonas sp. isolate Hart1]